VHYTIAKNISFPKKKKMISIMNNV